MEIVWTKQAQNSYLKNINYLENFWSEKEIFNFESEVFRTIEIIQTNVNIGIIEEKLNCKSILILKQTTLFYDVMEGKIVFIKFLG